MALESITTPVVKPDPPETNFQKKINATKNNLYTENIRIETLGKGDVFSAKVAGIDKFLTYGNKTYGSLGFDPYRAGGIEGVKSGNDVLYDSKVSGLDDFIQRGVPGMMKLAGIGVRDSFGLSVFANDLDYLTFDETMKNYSSSRGGDGSSQSGFDKFIKGAHNVTVSAGYTGGIIVGILGEELALAGITALSGGYLAPATGVLAAGTAARGIGLLARVGSKLKILKTIDKISDVNNARSWLSKGLKGFGKNLLPFSNTVDFIKGAEKLKGLSNTQVAVRGVGSLVRDARKFSMANSESKLEADLARKEFTENAYNDYYLNNKGLMSDKELNNISTASDKLYKNVYGANFGLIYITNAITFDGMLSNMNGISNLGSAARRFSIKGFGKGLGKITVKALPRTIGNAVKSAVINKVKGLTLKSAIGGTFRASMEGFQEISQDVISGSLQSFYRDKENVRRQGDNNYKNSPAYIKKQQFAGSFYKYISQDLNKARKKLWSEEGLTTFLSGFLTGAVVSPASSVSSNVSNYFLNSNSSFSVGKTKDFIFNNKKYNSSKANEMLTLKKEAEELEIFFNDPKSFNSVYDNSLFNQVELKEALEQSAINQNQNEFSNVKHELFTNGIYKLFKTGTEKEFSAHLKYMADNFNEQELSDIFNNDVITEKNKHKYQEKLRTNAQKIEEFKEIYDAVNETYGQNPINKSELKFGDKDYMSNYFKHKAFEDMKKELVFSYSKIQNRTERIKKIRANIAKTKNLNSLESNAFTSSADLQVQIDFLENEVIANNELLKTSKDENFVEKAKLIKKRLDGYKKYQSILNKIKKDGLFLEENTVDEYEDLFKEYEKILKTFTADELKTIIEDNRTITWRNEKYFKDIWDTLKLGQENEYFQKVVDTLISPDGQVSYMNGAIESNERINKNKKSIILNSLIAFQKRETSDDMLHELSDNNLFFNLDELDDLLNYGIMPINMYNLNTQELATKDEYETSVKILDKYVKKLTGKKIIELNSRTQQGRKLKTDKRKLVTLIRNFKIKLDQDLDLNLREGLVFLELLKVSNNLLYADKFLIDQVLENKSSDYKIKFVVNNELPVIINKEGVIELDLRFASSDYSSKNSMSFENLVTTGLIQKNLSDVLLNNEEVSKKIEDMMIVVKEKFLEKYENIDINELGVFSSPVDFISAALNDVQFQKLLSGIKYENETTVWKDFNANIKNVLKTEFDDNLLTPVINLATIALSKSEVDEIKPADKEVIEEETKKNDAEYNKANQEKINKKEELLQQKAKLEADLKKLQNQYDEATEKRKNLNLSLPKEDRELNKTILDLKKEKEELELKIKNLTESKANINLDPLLQEAAELMVANKEVAVSLIQRKLKTLEARTNEIMTQLELLKIVGPATYGPYFESEDGTISRDRNQELLVTSKEEIDRIFENLKNTESTTTDTKATELLNNYNKRVAEITDDYAKKINSVGKVRYRDNLEEARDKDLLKLKEEYNAELAALGTDTKADVGNTEVLDNARDNPVLFADYLHPEIYYGDKLLIGEWTKKIIELGKQLDDAKVTKWIYGNIRVQVDGRLVIDVETEVPVFVKKTMQNKKANPRIAELQKEIADLDVKIKDLNSKKKVTSQVLTEEGEQWLQKERKFLEENGRVEELKLFNSNLVEYVKNKLDDPLTQGFINDDGTPVYDDIKNVYDSLTTEVKTEEVKSTKKIVEFTTENTKFKTAGSLQGFLEDRGQSNIFSVDALDGSERQNNVNGFNSKVIENNGKTYLNVQKFRMADQVGRGSLAAVIFEVPNDLDYTDFHVGWNSLLHSTVDSKDYKKAKELIIKITLEKLNELQQAKLGGPPVLKFNVQSTGKNGMTSFLSDDKSFKMQDEGWQMRRVGEYDKTQVDDRGKIIKSSYYIKDGILGVIIPSKDFMGRPGGLHIVNVKVPDGFNENTFKEFLKNIEYSGNASEEKTIKLVSEIKTTIRMSLGKASEDNKSEDNKEIDVEIDNVLKQKNDLQNKLNSEQPDVFEQSEETVQQGTKKVKFLMYKSIGKGSTALSAGEWVPLLAIGKAIDEDNKEIEWFVKSIYGGQDPKFNKYGSLVFANIDRDLKVNELSLFTGAKGQVLSTNKNIAEEKLEAEYKVNLLKTLNAELNNKIEQINSLETNFTNKTDKTKKIKTDIAAVNLLIDELLIKISDLNKKINKLNTEAQAINISEESVNNVESETEVTESYLPPLKEEEEEEEEEEVKVEEEEEVEEIKNNLTLKELTDSLYDNKNQIKMLISDFNKLGILEFRKKRNIQEKLAIKRSIQEKLEKKIDDYKKIEEAEINKNIEDEKLNILDSDEINNEDEPINSKTSWDKIPKSLQTDLAELYDKPVDDLSQEDINNIKKLMTDNLNYIRLVNDFNNPKNLNEDIQEIKIEEKQVEEIVNQNDLITTVQPEEIIKEVVTDEEVVTDAKVKIEPVILNTTDLNINSELGKQINDLSQTLLNKSASESFDIIKPFLDKISVFGINSMKANALKSHKADYADVLKNAFILYFATKDTTLKDLTDVQLFTISDQINKLFNTNRFIDVALEINNEIYIIRNTNISRDKKLIVVLQKLDQNKRVSYNFIDLLNVSRIIAPGSTVDNSINTTINETDMTDLEGSYADIMKNFSNLVDGVDVISDEELLQQLKTELNKCK